MSSQPGILHADADAFFASVEQRDDPRLRRRPVFVGGGVVLAASYEARLRGVRSGMGGRKARGLCPDAVVVPPRFDAYVEASRQLFEVFRRMAPVVVGMSLEEAFLDVRGLEHVSGTPEDIALALREAVRVEVGLPLTVGGARSRALAKVASRAAKPDGVLIVRPQDERAFLDPLPVERLWGVGPATGARLRAHGLETVGQLARLDEPSVMRILGRAAGRHVHAASLGRDVVPMRPRGRRRRSVGAQHAIGMGPHSPRALDDALKGLADRVTRRMRSAGRSGRTVTLRLRYGDFSGRATRSRTLPAPTAATADVLAVARELLAESMPRIERRGITLVGIAVTNLVEDGGRAQLALPLAGEGEGRRRPPRARPGDPASVDAALDEVRRRYGSGAVTRAALLGRDRRLATWLMPGDEPGAEEP